MQAWVSLNLLWDEEPAGRLYEIGGVYRTTPPSPAEHPTRALVPDEPTVGCPRCGQRFAATREGTRTFSADENLHCHIDGDAERWGACPASRHSHSDA